jgi:hypothetical protein
MVIPETPNWSLNSSTEAPPVWRNTSRICERLNCAEADNGLLNLLAKGNDMNTWGEHNEQIEGDTGQIGLCFLKNRTNMLYHIFV